MPVYKFEDMLIDPAKYPWGYGLSEFAYLSPLASAATGWPTGGSGYNDTRGECDPCYGAVTFVEALQYAYDEGGRLPTLDEALNNATGGTGCSYDSKMIWTCDKGLTNAEHWVVLGKNGTGTAETRSNGSTAYVRFVADNDLSRPDPVMLIDLVIYAWLGSQI